MFVETAPDPEPPSPADLGDQIAELAAHLSVATSRLVTLVARFDESGAWAAEGAKSCAHWLSWRCCLSAGAAREYVRVGRRLHAMPLLCAAFERGELSYSQVRALTRIDDVHDEQALIELARHSTAAQLERIVRAYRGVTDAEAVVAAQRRFLSIRYEDDGSATIRGRLPAEDAAVLEQALAAAQDTAARAARTGETATEAPVAGHHSHGSAPVNLDDDAQAEVLDPDDPAGARRADALTALCDDVLAGGGAPAARSAGDRHQIVIHLDADRLAGDPAGRGELDNGSQLAPGVVERLCCDAALVTALERDGQPLSIGRKTRAIPPAIGRALRHRDRGCRFPGCTQRHGVDAHHIVPWSRGGPTSLDNLVLICRRHHTLVHEGGFTLQRDDQGKIVVRAPGGRVLESAPPPRRRADPGCLHRTHHHAGQRIDANTLRPRWDGTPLDLPRAVDALLDVTVA